MSEVTTPPRPDRTALESLLARVMACDGADRDIDQDLYCDIGGCPVDEDGHQSAYRAPAYTASLDAAVRLVEWVLPGWWQSSGLCSLTGHASIGPDYNGPHAERLRQEWPEEQFHEGFHADLKPGDGRHRQCLALVHTLLQAEIARAR